MIESDNWPEFRFACNGGAGCVVVEKIAGAIVIRDSKNPFQPGLVFSKKEYADFRRRLRDGNWAAALAASLVSLLRWAAVGLRRLSGC